MTGGFVEGCREDPRFEDDIPAEIEAVGDMLGIAQDLRLGGIALSPLPFLLERVRELVGILHAFDIATRAGVTVPIPGTADPTSGLEDSRRETHRANAVEHVEPSEAGADDYYVELIGGHVSPYQGRSLPALPYGNAPFDLPWTDTPFMTDFFEPIVALFTGPHKPRQLAWGLSGIAVSLSNLRVVRKIASIGFSACLMGLVGRSHR